MIGYTVDEIRELTFADITPSSRAGVDREAVSAMARGDARQYITEKQYLRKDGELFWGQLVSTPIRNENGEVECYIAMVEDITERKQAEEALQENEEKFRSIVENALAGMFTVDNTYHFIYVNEELCKILGYSEEQLLRMDFREVLSDDSREMVSERYVRRQRGEEVPPRYEMSIVRADGKIRNVEMSVTVVRDKDGNAHSMGQLVDITDRKQAEEALRAKTEELDRFFTVTLDLLCIADTDGYFRRLNPQWEKVLGYSLQELEERHFLDLVHPDDHASTLAALEAARKSGLAIAGSVDSLQRRDGSG